MSVHLLYLILISYHTLHICYHVMYDYVLFRALYYITFMFHCYLFTA